MENIKIGKEVNRGHIFYAKLNGKIGSEQRGTRPVVILQNDLGNRYSTTVIVAPLTTQVDSKPKLRTHVNVENYESKLVEDSIILTEQITVIDKCRLISYRSTYKKADRILWSSSKRTFKTCRKFRHFKWTVWEIHINTYRIIFSK